MLLRQNPGCRADISSGAALRWCYAEPMLGRVLLSVIALVITASLALPFLPARVSAPDQLALDAAHPAADMVATRCGDCAADSTARICASACPCTYALVVAWAGSEASLGVTLELLAWPLPGGLPARPQPLPPKAPAI